MYRQTQSSCTFLDRRLVRAFNFKLGPKLGFWIFCKTLYFNHASIKNGTNPTEEFCKNGRKN